MRKNSRQLVLFFSVLATVTLACSLTLPSINTGSSEAMPGLAGSWQDPETLTVHTVEWTGSAYRVVSCIDEDNTSFPITEQSWEGGVLTWTYYVPSTGYYVTFETDRLDGNDLYTKWSGTAGSGTETLHRVSAPSGSSGSSIPMQGLAGSWEDPETLTVHTIEWTGSEYKVVSCIDEDDENFPITEQSWSSGVLSWTYYVPSTGYYVSFETVRLDGDDLYTNWGGTAGSGTETLHRVR